MSNQSDRTEWFTDDEKWLGEVKGLVSECESIIAGLQSTLKYMHIHENALKQYQEMIESSEKLLAAEQVIALAGSFSGGNKPEALDAEEHAVNDKIHHFVGDLHNKLLERHNAIMAAEQALKDAATK